MKVYPWMMEEIVSNLGKRALHVLNLLAVHIIIFWAIALVKYCLQLTSYTPTLYHC